MKPKTRQAPISEDRQIQAAAPAEAIGYRVFSSKTGSCYPDEALYGRDYFSLNPSFEWPTGVPVGTYLVQFLDGNGRRISLTPSAQVTIHLPEDHSQKTLRTAKANASVAEPRLRDFDVKNRESRLRTATKTRHVCDLAEHYELFHTMKMDMLSQIAELSKIAQRHHEIELSTTLMLGDELAKHSTQQAVVDEGNGWADTAVEALRTLSELGRTMLTSQAVQRAEKKRKVAPPTGPTETAKPSLSIEEVTAPVTQSVAQTVASPIASPIAPRLAQPVTQSVTQNVTQSVTQFVTSPIAPRLAQPVTQSVTQPVTHAVAQLVASAVTPSVTVSASLPLDRSVVVDSPDCIADSPTITACDENTVAATETLVAVAQQPSLPIPAADSNGTASPSGCTDAVCLDGEATEESTLPDGAARLTEEGGPSTAGPESPTESAQPQATHHDGPPVPSAASTQHADAPTAKSPGPSSPAPTPTDASKGAALVRSQDPFVQSWRSIKHFVAHMTDIDVMVFTPSLPMFRSFLSMLRALTPFYKGPTVSLDELIEAAGEAPG